MVKHITSKELDELLSKSELPVVCDFWATWCGPCRMLAPVFEQVSEKFDQKAVFVKVDVDENEEAAVKHEISSIPNIIVFKDGKAKDNSLGFVPESALEAFIKKNL